MPRLARLLLLAAVLPGASLLAPACVVTYGSATDLRSGEPLPPPADFAEVEQRLSAMVDGETDLDRRDRLDAALDLLKAGRTMDPKDQERVLRYLQRVVSIEERSQPMEAPTIFDEALPETTATFSPITGGIVEEDLGGYEVLEGDEVGEGEEGEGQESGGQESGGQESEGQESEGQESEGQESGTGVESEDAAPPTAPADGPRVLPSGDASGAQTADPVSMARSALDAGDPAGALAALEPCGLVDCADGAAELRAEAEAAWIHSERERAGALFVRARSEPDATERKARLVEAREILAGLLDRFPQAEQAEAIKRNIELVQKELDTLQ